MAAGGLTGVLLVGGASRRFGSPKALAELGGETLAERGWRTLGEACSERIAVGKRGDVLDLPFAVLEDAFESRAAFAGLVTGLRAATSDMAVVLPVDMPLICPDDLRMLASACVDASVPAQSPLPCAVRKTVLAAFEDRIARGELALRDAFAAVATRTVAIDDARLANVNTPADLDALRASTF